MTMTTLPRSIWSQITTMKAPKRPVKTVTVSLIFSLILHSLVLSPIPDEEPCHPDDEVVYEDALPGTTNIGSNGPARPYRRLSLDRSQTVIKPIPRGSSFFVLSHTNRSEPKFDVSKLIFFFLSFSFRSLLFFMRA